MKLLMATCSDKSQKHAPYTLPIHKMFARKWGADFKVLNDTSYNKMGSGMWNYRTMIFHELLDTYDRIFYLDSDIVINKTCPNIFDIVPYDTVGLVFEDKGTRFKNRMKRIKAMKKIFGDCENWKTGYLNGGLYIVSKIHRNIFTKINGKLWDSMGYDCVHYCYQIMKQGHKFIDLGYGWNHMSMFSEKWNGSPSRFDSHIIHYAGKGAFLDKGNRSRIDLIKDDIKRIYGGLVD